MDLVDGFIGRAAELAQIPELITEPACSGVLITGPVGVGKSRLAGEIIRLAEGLGYRSWRIRTSAASRRVPLGAFSTLSQLGAPELGTAQSALELADRWVARIEDDDPTGRLMLVVDDAHLVDDISMLVLDRLAESGRVFLVLTARSEEVQEGAFADLSARGLLRTLPLPPLDRAEAQTLIERCLPGVDEDDLLVRRLMERSGGNPLFLLELIRGSLEMGKLVQLDGQWRLRGELDASGRIREVVEFRLRGLARAELNVLELLAYADTLDTTAFERFADVDVLLRLEERGLITTRLDRRQVLVSLAHPVYGDVLRTNMSGLRTQATTAAIAEHLERQASLTDEERLKLASLRLISGGGDAATMESAARTALDRHDLELAMDCVDAAIEDGGGLDARILRARVLSRRGEYEKADAEILGCLDAAPSDEQLAEAATLRLDFLAWYQGRAEGALEFAADVEARIADPSLRDSVAIRRVAALIQTEGPLAVVKAVQPLLTSDSPQVRNWVCIPAAWGYHRIGEFAKAHAFTRQGEAANEHDTHQTDWYPEYHHVQRCFIEAGAGRIRAARAEAERAAIRAREEESDDVLADYSLFLASLARDCGHTKDALDHADAALAAYRRLGRTQFLHDAVVHRAIVLGVAGRGDDAIEGLEALRDSRTREYWYFSPELHQARAWAHAANGHRQAAQDEFLASVRVSNQTGDLVGELAAWHGSARIGFAREAVEPLRKIVRQMDSDLARSRLTHCLGLAMRDAAQLQEASERFEAAGADLLAAEAAVSAGRALQRAGAPREALTWQRRATAAFRQQQGPTIDLVGAGRPKALTASEYDTAKLAATGQTNAQIAEAMGLSIRTVENRLQRVYAKLGVSGRHALNLDMLRAC